ncbi:MAG TPA: NlpC/P60 family protein [Herpetosiphonaceae bacterium]
MRPPLIPAPYRRPAAIGLPLLAIGLLLPLALWWSLPARRPGQARPAPPAAPEIVRVGAGLDEPIPGDWRPPDLNPALEAAALALPETLSATAALSAPLLPLAELSALPGGAAGLVASEALNLRDGPGGQYVALAALPQQANLRLLGRYDGWYQVAAGELTGWVDGAFVATSVPSATLPLVGEIPPPSPELAAWLAESVDRANLRSGPSRDSAALAVLTPASGELRLLLSFDGWYQVRTAAGSEGWVAAELLSTTPYIARRVPALTASPEGLEAVRLARRYIGTRYVWGGETPRQGFDCSGLVMYVYGKLGVELPHSAAAQWSTRFGAKVARRSELRPGDVVFFRNTYKRGISHVGIYAGQGLVIQAISESVGISVSALDEPYWSSRYVGAIRPFP